ncbi:MAG: DUF1499 domain-containing protein [Sphingomonadales bacterium]|nr:DUF1499 domain-containing protein [Sphingomonadales bacterium]
MEALRKKHWAGRLTFLAAILCFGAVAVALIAALGSARGAWPFRIGFKLLEYALYGGAAGILLALIAALFARRVKPKLVIVNLLAILVAGAFVGFLGNQVRIARSVPRIHDIATNLDDYPRFYRLTVRADNLENVPDMGRRDLAALPPRERWKAVHRDYYGDIAPIRVPWSVEETATRVRRLADERGWEIVTFDPANGILEAVDTSFFFRFKDNIVVRARPVSGGGGGSIVDMRSISRVGVSDVGVNARRVRSFLADLRRG